MSQRAWYSQGGSRKTTAPSRGCTQPFGTSPAVCGDGRRHGGLAARAPRLPPGIHVLPRGCRAGRRDLHPAAEHADAARADDSGRVERRSPYARGGVSASGARVSDAEATVFGALTRAAKAGARVSDAPTDVTVAPTRVSEAGALVTEPVTRVRAAVTSVTEPVTPVTVAVTRVTEPVTPVTETVTRVSSTVTRVASSESRVHAVVTRVTEAVARPVVPPLRLYRTKTVRRLWPKGRDEPAQASGGLTAGAAAAGIPACAFPLTGVPARDERGRGRSSLALKLK